MNPRLIAVLLVAVTGGSVALGDTAPPGGGRNVPAELSAGRSVMTNEQLLARAERASKEATGIRSSVTNQLSAARRARDVLRVLCLSDKRNQAELASATIQSRVTDLKDALNSGDRDGASHQANVIEVLRSRMLVLATEAQQCLGEDGGGSGDATITVDVDPNAPGSDGTTTFDGVDLAPPAITPPESDPAFTE